jgi:hypothetical protein
MRIQVRGALMATEKRMLLPEPGKLDDRARAKRLFDHLFYVLDGWITQAINFVHLLFR